MNNGAEKKGIIQVSHEHCVVIINIFLSKADFILMLSGSEGQQEARYMKLVCKL